MTIRTYLEFYNLIKNDNLPVSSELTACVQSVAKTCLCNKSLKAKRVEQCNSIYINWVKNNASKYVQYWKHKTNNDKISFFHTQTYEIISIKLI
jgi:hypothetical protein